MVYIPPPPPPSPRQYVHICADWKPSDIGNWSHESKQHRSPCSCTVVLDRFSGEVIYDVPLVSHTSIAVKRFREVRCKFRTTLQTWGL